MSRSLVKTLWMTMLAGALLAAVGYALGGGGSAVVWDRGGPHVMKNEAKSLDITEPLQFKSLTVRASVADVLVVQGDEFRIEADYASGESPDYELNGDELTVFDSGAMPRALRINIGPLNLGAVSNQMTVTVPRSVKLDSIDMRSDVGSAALRGLSASRVKVAASTGKVELWDIECDDFDAVANVGSIQLNGVRSTRSFTAVSNAGSIKGSADPRGDVELRAEVGSIDLALTQPRSSYIVDAKADLGSVRLTPDIPNPDSAPNRMTLRSEVGSIIMRFGD